MPANSKSFWTRNFIILIISNALLFMSYEMLTPTLPLLAQSIGCTPAQIGLAVGAVTISAMIIRPASGKLKYRMDKKYLLIIGVFVCTLATGSYMFTVSLLALLAFRLLHGFGFGIATTFYATLASEELPPERIGEGMGLYGIGETVCISVGPMLGIAFLNQSGYNGVFFASAAIVLLAALLIFGITRSKSKSPMPHTESRPLCLLEKRVLPQAILGLLLGIVVSGVVTFIAVFAKQLGIANVAWFFFIAAITGIFIRLIAGKLFDRKGPLAVLLPSGLLLIVSMILISCSQSALLLNIAGIFYGVAFGAIFPSLQAWTINKVDFESRENAMSSFLNFFDLGFGGGSLLLGFIAGATSYRVMYLLLPVFIAAYMALATYEIKYKHIPKKASGKTDAQDIQQ